MLRYLVVRLLATIPVLFVTAVTVFVLGQMLPGDPIEFYLGGPEAAATEGQVELVRAQYGLDQPIAIQFFTWLGNLLRGDFGRSYGSGQPVLDIILPRMLPTAQIGIQGVLLGAIAGVGLGILAAQAPNSLRDWVASILAIVGVSLPHFLKSILLIFLFALMLGWLPSSGWVSPFVDPFQSLRTTLLPTIVLALYWAAIITRQTRSSLIEVLQQPYVTTARSKGLRERIVVQRHTLRIALLPVLTILGFSIGHIFGGAVIIETVFAIPGMGRLLISSVLQREYLVLQALVLIIAVTVVLANLLVDLLYGLFDPRIRVTR